MAGENDVKTKVGVMKAMARALQQEAFYKDTTQFDTRAFQEIFDLLRRLNEFEQQLLLSAEHILLRGTLAGMSVEKIQELIPEVEEWIKSIDSRERKLAKNPTAKASPPADLESKKKPGPEESADNAGKYFAGMEPGKAMDVQVPPSEAPPPIYYYGEHRFSDGERVQLRFTDPAKHLSSLEGVHIMTDEEEAAAAKAGLIERGKFTYETEADVVDRYRLALEREREDLPPPEPAVDLEDGAHAAAGEEDGEEGAAEDIEQPTKPTRPARKRAAGGTGKKPAVSVH